MSVSLDKNKAVFWGRFIEIASLMDGAGVSNPPQPEGFPNGWQLVKNIIMQVKVGFVTQTEFIGIVAQKGNTGRYAVVLHGNVGILDFIEELSFFKTDFPFFPDFGKTENGFTRLYESISFIDPKSGESQSLEAYLRGLNPRSAFTVAGYSVGGALGIMHAAVLAQLHFPVEAYIMGAPMVGDAVFAQRFHSLVPKTFLIVNKPDIVPQLPGALFGYRNVSTPFEIDSLTFPEIHRNIFCYHSLEVYLYVLGDIDIDLGQCRIST